MTDELSIHRRLLAICGARNRWYIKCPLCGMKVLSVPSCRWIALIGLLPLPWESFLNGALTSPAASVVSDSLYLAGGFAATAGPDVVSLELDRRALAEFPGFQTFQATIIPRTAAADLFRWRVDHRLQVVWQEFAWGDFFGT